MKIGRYLAGKIMRNVSEAIYYEILYYTRG
jgi:hypothetical protein